MRRETRAGHRVNVALATTVNGKIGELVKFFKRIIALNTAKFLNKLQISKNELDPFISNKGLTIKTDSLGTETRLAKGSPTHTLFFRVSSKRFSPQATYIHT